MSKSLKILSIIICVVFCKVYSFQKFESADKFELKGKNWKIFKIEGLKLKRDESGKFYIGLKENLESKNSDLLIDFENFSLHPENYRVLYSSFVLNKIEKFSGVSSGKFAFRDSCIKLLPLETSIFYPGNELGSFSIDFWLYPYKNYDKQYVIYYACEDIDSVEPKKYGFSISVENGKLFYRFENFFYDTSKIQSVEKVEISEDQPLNLYRWEHHGIAFSSKDGKLALYRNGVEEKVSWITKENSKGKAIFYPYVHNNLSSPIIIGKNSFFSLDNLRFTKEFFTNYEMFPLNRREAYLITKVFKISDNFFSIKEIKLSSKLDAYSFIKIGYRISSEVFSPDDENIPWIYVNLENFNPLEDLSSGKYIQFKIIVYPEVANEDVKIYSLTLKYSIDEAPYTPYIVKTIAGDEEVEIHWVPSPEDDIEGYEIYYGNESKNYICNDGKEGSSPIFVKKKTEGLELHKAKLSLKNEKPYFIAIRAVDKKGHKSKYSKEVYVRPSSIHNKNGYSINR